MTAAKDTTTLRQCCLDLIKAEASRDYERALKICNKSKLFSYYRLLGLLC